MCDARSYIVSIHRHLQSQLSPVGGLGDVSQLLVALRCKEWEDLWC